jgi:hypothetical protein
MSKQHSASWHKLGGCSKAVVGVGVCKQVTPESVHTHAGITVLFSCSEFVIVFKQVLPRKHIHMCYYGQTGECLQSQLVTMRLEGHIPAR